MDTIIHRGRKQGYMDWLWDVIKEETGKVVALILASIGAIILAGLKRLPKFIGFERTILDELTIINRAEALRLIFRTLKRHSGALYIHIIRYHNGKKIEHEGDPVIYDRMSVEYEIIGHTCGDCGTDCFKITGVPEVKHEWQKIPIADDWRAEAYDKTMASKGQVNTVRKEQMSKVGQEIFDRLKIEIFKEIFICKTKRGTYTLGLSFCSRYRKVGLADGMMVLAAKNLSNSLLR